MTPGQPTNYKKEYCNEIIELGKKGLHGYEMAMHFNVCIQTLYNWAKYHPEFLESFTRARNFSKAWLLENMRENLSNRNYNGKLAEFYAKFMTEREDQKKADLMRIPGFNECNDLKEKMICAFNAMGSGILSPQECESVISSLDKAIKSSSDQQELADLMDELKQELQRQKEKV